MLPATTMLTIAIAYNNYCSNIFAYSNNYAATIAVTTLLAATTMLATTMMVVQKLKTTNSFGGILLRNVMKIRRIFSTNLFYCY